MSGSSNFVIVPKKGYVSRCHTGAYLYISLVCGYVMACVHICIHILLGDSTVDSPVIVCGPIYIYWHMCTHERLHHFAFHIIMTHSQSIRHSAGRQKRIGFRNLPASFRESPSNW